MTSATISLYNDDLFVFTPICCVGGSCFICYLYLFTFTGVQHDFHLTWCSCLLTTTRRVSLVKQELSTLPEHLITTPVFNVVHVAESLVFCVVFCISLFLFSVDYCIACFSSIEGFWLSIWYIQTFRGTPILFRKRQIIICRKSLVFLTKVFWKFSV